MMITGKNKKAILVLLMLAGPVIGACGESLIQRISFREAAPTFAQTGGYQTITCAGLINHGKPGAPWLPVKTVTLLLPPQALVRAVKAQGDSRELPGRFNLMPAQQRRPISGGPYPETGKDPDIYGSDQDHPGDPVVGWSQGNSGGYNLVSLTVCPFSYRPRDGLLRMFPDLEVTVEYEVDHTRRPMFRRPSQWVASSTVNYNAASVHYPPQGSAKSQGYDLLIITTAQLDTVFERLAAWKNQKGIRTKVAAIDTVYSNYPGRDPQEKVRNFVIAQHRDNGISHLLLGGDYGLVPARTAFAMHSGYEDSAHVGIDSLICDLYYGDLDGSWDLNGNSIFGEKADSVDLYPDIWVGRAVAGSPEQARTFVDKVLTYEKGPPSDYLGKASFWASYLDANTDAAKGKDLIDRNYLTDYYRPVEKLYQSSGNEDPVSIIQSLHSGDHLINHNGHSGFFKMQGGNGWLDTVLMDTLKNQGHWGILYSQGCQAAGFDSSSIAEHYLNNPQGGGLAFIGNSRYGWYLPYFPGYGPSDLYDNAFFEQLLTKGAPDLGRALGYSKADMIALSQLDEYCRWINYDLNLLGDPTLAVWTAAPESLQVICSDSIGTGAIGLQVCVLKAGRPAGGAAVTLLVDSAYIIGFTDLTGQTILSGYTTRQQTALLTAWTANGLPRQKDIGITAPGPSLALAGQRWVETAGNGDGLAGPGESGSLELLIRNDGTLPSGADAQARLIAADSLTTVSDSLADISGLLPGDSSWTTGVPALLIDPSCRDGDVAQFRLELADSAGNLWSCRLGQALSAPVLQYRYHLAEDSGWGNDNGIIEPGETTAVRAFFKNLGRASMAKAVLNLSSPDPLITVLQAEDSLLSLPSDSVGSAVFVLKADPGVPGPAYVASLDLDGLYDGQAFHHILPLAVGQTGLADSVEDGAGGWRLSDSSYWHISTLRSHSPVHSWYFGSDSSGLAPPRSIDTLETPPFMLGPDCRLSLWMWYDLVPGWAYGYIEVEDSSGTRLLDVITGLSQQWEMREYDLSSYRAGQLLKVRFIANVDSSGHQAQGWFIDDIILGTGVSGVADRPPDASPADRLLQNRPNPFSRSTVLTFQLGQRTWAELSVYNLLGQKIRTLAAGIMPPGTHSACWDGTDPNGQGLSGGIYFIRLAMPGRSLIRRMVMLR